MECLRGDVTGAAADGRGAYLDPACRVFPFTMMADDNLLLMTDDDFLCRRRYKYQ